MIAFWPLRATMHHFTMPRPRAWLDFETVNPAVSRWIGTRSYQQVPFQFSFHLEAQDGSIKHHEFDSMPPTRLLET